VNADDLIAQYALAPHPEGGWYRRIYASTLMVSDGARQRPAVTSILYLLRAGETSRWHCVRSDELWHFYGGAPLDLLHADAAFDRVDQVRLGPMDAPAAALMHAVPASAWQAARSTGAYSFVGCSVAPGFSFDDFVLLADAPQSVERLRARWPAYVDWL
jgi:predicted cupin superfamily sugar epimerase